MTLAELLSSIEGVYARMSVHERELFERCVAFLEKGDCARASLYAEDCAEVRKLLLKILRCKFMAERLVAELVNVVSLLNVLRDELRGVVPELAYRIGCVIEELGVRPQEANDWAREVFEEASEAAERKLKELKGIPSFTGG